MIRHSKASDARKTNGHVAVRWSFRSERDVNEYWNRFNRVPARRKRTKRDEERYCFALYLLALATHRKLTYPIRVEEGESPDFIITWHTGKKTGLEVTKATEMWVQREMTKAEVEYERRESAARIAGTEPEGVAIMLSEHGWAGDQAESEWLSFVKQAVERKLPKLVAFRPTSRDDLLVYDDTPLPAVDRSKVLSHLSRWLSATRRTNPALGRVSIVISLDLVLDAGKAFQVLPFVDWSNPKNTPDFGERVEFAGEKAVRTKVRAHEAAGNPIYLTGRHGRLVKRMPDGTRYEVRVEPNGDEVVIGELVGE